MTFTSENAKVIKLKWIDGYPGPAIEDHVRQNIAEKLSGMEKPSDLITHTVFLSENHGGPCVSVWGEEGVDDCLWCQYLEDSLWIQRETIWIGKKF